jgi:hypothetical protein
VTGCQLDRTGEYLVDVGGREVQVPEEAEGDQRASPSRFYHHERREPRDPQLERYEGGRRTPASLLRLAEAQRQGTDPGRKHEQPGDVERPAGTGLGPQGQGVKQGQ